MPRVCKRYKRPYLGGRLCPVLDRSRRREAARGGGEFHGPCPKPPYVAALIASTGKIGRLKMIFDELDGYAGGTYEATIPVTRGFITLLRPEYRSAFVVSRGSVRVCNSTCLSGRP
jgi:hypothetical protein